MAELSFALWNDGFNLRDIIDANPDKTGEVFYLIQEDKVERVFAPFGSFGPVVPIVLNGKVNLYPSQPLSDTGTPTPVASIPLEPGVRVASVILIPQGKEQPYRWLTIDSDPLNFPSNTIRFQSLFPNTIHVRVDKSQFTLPPFSSGLITLNEDTRRGVQLLVVVSEEDPRRIRPLIQRFIHTQPGSRIHAFIAPHPMKPGAAELRLMTAAPAD